MAPPCPLPPPVSIAPPPTAPYVWPISAIAALAVHGLGYLWWYQHPLNAPSPALVPVTLVTVEPAPAVSPPSESWLPGNPTLADPLPSPPAVTRPSPAPLPPPDTQSFLPEVSISQPSHSTPDPSLPTSPPQSSSVSPSPTPQGLLPAPLRTQWQITPVPQGRDLPETLPQVPPGQEWQAISLENFPQCVPPELTLGNTPLQVTLQLLVTPEGRIAQTWVWQSSGNAAYDRAIACILPLLPTPLIPAMAGGAPILSDAALLVVSHSPDL